MLLLMMFFGFVFHLSQITYKVSLSLRDNFCEHFGPRSDLNFVESDMVQNILVKVKNQLFELKNLSSRYQNFLRACVYYLIEPLEEIVWVFTVCQITRVY